ncbi:MAG TPA: hypothetical protein VH372_18300 [Actinospica sp.]|nr:hypothetical protein [Actinospica sp.]
MNDPGREWLDALPAELHRQQRIIDGLIEASTADDDIEWLVIGCSVARGAGDELSDLDMAVGVAGDEADFPAIARRVRRTVERLGELVESYHHQLPGVPAPHERIFVQYADRCQLDLVVLPASAPGGSGPHAIVLYDPDQLLTVREERRPLAPEQMREWAFHAWCALADLGKYLRRGSLWEAYERLHSARGQLWQLQAVAHGVRDPQYGITSILDFAPESIPDEMRATVADLDGAQLLRAARQLAEMLNAVSGLLPENLSTMLPHAMARYITDDLNSLEIEVR